jgi:hypothetical protein
MAGAVVGLTRNPEGAVHEQLPIAQAYSLFLSQFRYEVHIEHKKQCTLKPYLLMYCIQQEVHIEHKKQCTLKPYLLMYCIQQASLLLYLEISSSVIISLSYLVLVIVDFFLISSNLVLCCFRISRLYLVFV